jgi:putative protein-disulfide isomerase
MIPMIYYCYDAYCGWCYGFSKVIIRIAEEYKDLDLEVLSGGMIPAESAKPISRIAPYIKNEYKRVEELTGIKFGKDYLWHIEHPELSDWRPNSVIPAIALCIFKEYYPDRSVFIVSDIQYALHYEGRDLTDDESYRPLLSKYNIPPVDFYRKLHSEEYKEKAYYEFALVKQLKVNGFPSTLLQVADTKFYLLSRGYTDYETFRERIESVLKEIK